MAIYGWRGVTLLALAMLLAGPAPAAERHAAERHAAEPHGEANPANERLMRETPPQRAAQLAHVVGHWCIGTETFPMGIAAAGPAKGNAYWSVRCADGTTWAVQIDPLAEVTAIDCDSFKARGGGKECFKKF
ncbi:MAG TPA: hypothetical protein VHY35_22015 [Stellaceae bacterium]|jgi:hypothetical protein|nr:hypothetical protein [Stellaceae bacterium]